MEDTIEFLIDKYGVCPTGGEVCTIEDDSKYGFPVMLNELDFKFGAEIGVHRGSHCRMLCEAIPKLKLLCIDSWQYYDDYRQRYSQDRLDGCMEQTKQVLTGYDFQIIKGDSIESSKNIPDESLDFVFIDANHEFQHVVNDIAAWAKKVRPGGIVSGHDFKDFRAPQELIQVKDAVLGWTHAYDIQLFVFEGDNGPIWFYIK